MSKEVFCTVNENRVRTLTLVIPLYGLWTADAVLAQNASLTDARAVLTLNEMTLIGHVYRSGDFTGTGSFRLVGGFGGWGKVIGPKFYQNQIGVKRSLVIGDAAKECGEKVRFLSGADGVIGFHYARTRGIASQVIYQTTDQKWWVDDDGTTVIGDRATPIVASAFDVIPENTKIGLGRINVATDFPGDWRPGVFFSSPVLVQKQASAIVHRLTATSFRTEVWTTP